MKQNQKGFTLIELLAVIVILAVIALIATPMILGVIDSAKKGAAESSAYGYISALENSTLKDMIDSQGATTLLDGDYKVATNGTTVVCTTSATCNSTTINVSYKGDAPANDGTFTVAGGKISKATFKINNITVNYDGSKAKAS